MPKYRDNRRIRNSELPSFCKLAKLQKSHWIPDDGRPIIGVNQSSDRRERPYVVLRNITCIHPVLDDAVIPQGFTTDLGSIPWILKIIPGFRPTDPGTRAFLRHDWEYRHQRAERKLIDVVMESDLIADGMSRWQAKLCFWGVRLFGWKAWQDNEKRNAN